MNTSGGTKSGGCSREPRSVKIKNDSTCGGIQHFREDSSVT